MVNQLHSLTEFQISATTLSSIKVYMTRKHRTMQHHMPESCLPFLDISKTTGISHAYSNWPLQWSVVCHHQNVIKSHSCSRKIMAHLKLLLANIMYSSHHNSPYNWATDRKNLTPWSLFKYETISSPDMRLISSETAWHGIILECSMLPQWQLWHSQVFYSHRWFCGFLQSSIEKITLNGCSWKKNSTDQRLPALR